MDKGVRVTVFLLFLVLFISHQYHVHQLYLAVNRPTYPLIHYTLALDIQMRCHISTSPRSSRSRHLVPISTIASRVLPEVLQHAALA